jgi:hypothetical protein
MQKFQELESEYILNKQALREARKEIINAEAFALKHNAGAVVCIHDGVAKVWVQVLPFSLFLGGELSEEMIAGKRVFVVDGVKVITC